MSLSLSDRCLRIAPSVTLAIDSKAKEMKAQGIDVIGFGAGEPDFNTPDYILDAAKYALDEGMTKYTPVAGTLALRQQIVKKLKEENGLDYDVTEIIVSNGAKHSLFNAMSAIVNPGDEVIIPSPCWVSYPEMVQMVGGVPVLVDGPEKNYFLPEIDALRAAVTDKTKAIILNSPNNPCGNIWPKALLREVAELAVEKQIYVISDEIYEKLIYDGHTHTSIASLGEEIKNQTIVINGVSKSYAMTGWRIGYAAGPKSVIKAMTSFQSHATSNPNSIAQYAAAEALSNGKDYMAGMVKKFEERRTLMYNLINAIDGVNTNLPAGAFYVMMNISGLIGKSYRGQKIEGSSSFAEILLAEKNVAVVPAKAFGSDIHVRLSYAVASERIETGLKRIAEFVAECK